MLLQVATNAHPYTGTSITSFILILLVWAIIIGGIYLLIKKVIKPLMSYIKTKQEYYQAQTESLKKDRT